MSQLYPQFPLSTFPNNIDNPLPFIDVTPEDGEKIGQYYQAVESGQKVLASQILQSIPNGNQKIISAQRFNSFLHMVLATETFYKNDIKPFIGIKQQEWQNISNQFGFYFDYSPTTQYKKNNIVLFNDNGLIQLHINIFDGTTPIGNSPLNLTYWRAFTVRGQTGKAGENLTNFSFDWESEFEYTLNSIVIYDNAWWIAKRPSRNQPPNTFNSLYWDLVITTRQAVYPVQSTQPAGQSVGEMWFRVVT